MSTYLDLAPFTPYDIEVQVAPANGMPAFRARLLYPMRELVHVAEDDTELLYPLRNVTPVLYSFRALERLQRDGNSLLLTILYSLLDESDRALVEWGKGYVKHYPSKSGGKLVAILPKKNGNQFQLTISRSWLVYGPYAGASHELLAIHQLLREAHVAVGLADNAFIPKKLSHAQPRSRTDRTASRL